MSRQETNVIIIRIAMSLVLAILLFASGCANTGPRISRDELKKLEEEIETLATELFIKDWVRTWKVGYNFLGILPEGTLKKRAVIGALIVKNSEDIAKLYNLSTDEGYVVIGTIDNFIANLAGLQPGDLIKEIDGEKIEEINQIKFETDKFTEIIIEREGSRQAFEVQPEEMPYVKITLKETGAINAYAKIGEIRFSSGMVHFVKDDNELAVVMGHELAHLISKHIPKSMGVGALCGIVGVLTGPFAPLTFKSLYAPYSRGNEREADYLGLIYAHSAGYDIEKGMELWRRFAFEIPKSRSKSFLRSHPASPERILRVKKVVELIKSGKNPLEDLFLN